MPLCWSILLVAVLLFLVLIHFHSALFSIFSLLWMNEKLYSAAVHLFPIFSYFVSVFFSISSSFVSESISFLSLSASHTKSLCCLSAHFLQQKYTRGNRCFDFLHLSIKWRLKMHLFSCFQPEVSSVCFVWPLFCLEKVTRRLRWRRFCRFFSQQTRKSCWFSVTQMTFIKIHPETKDRKYQSNNVSYKPGVNVWWKSGWGRKTDGCEVVRLVSRQEFHLLLVSGLSWIAEGCHATRRKTRAQTFQRQEKRRGKYSRDQSWRQKTQVQLLNFDLCGLTGHQHGNLLLNNH